MVWDSKMWNHTPSPLPTPPSLRIQPESLVSSSWRNPPHCWIRLSTWGKSLYSCTLTISWNGRNCEYAFIILKIMVLGIATIWNELVVWFICTGTPTINILVLARIYFSDNILVSSNSSLTALLTYLHPFLKIEQIPPVWTLLDNAFKNRKCNSSFPGIFIFIACFCYVSESKS